MKPKVLISERKLKKLLLAEKVCKELRYQIAAPPNGFSWHRIIQWLSRYQRLAGKEYYLRPEKPKKKLFEEYTQEEREALLEKYKRNDSIRKSFAANSCS